MNLIRKGPPPPALVTFRKTPDDTSAPPKPPRYDGPGFEAVKQMVRDGLVAEQRGVCCYCTDRIAPDEARMKIEHRVPQRGPAGDPSRDLDWTNLFGACRGELTAPGARGSRALHCDSAKQERALTLDPTDDTHIAALGYAPDGRMTSTRPQHQTELDEVLCLNHQALRERRVRALSELKLELARRYRDRRFPVEKLERLLHQLRDPPGTLRPYSAFLCWWVERAIRRAGAH